MEVAQVEQIDVFLLQEALLMEGSSFRPPRYWLFFYPWVRGHNRGCAVLVRNHIRCQEVEDRIKCGDGVEAQAVTLLPPTTALKFITYVSLRGLLWTWESSSTEL